MSPLPSLEGANILVTGASSGIGAALAEMLASKGANVGIVARRADRLADTLHACLAHGEGHRMWTVDLADPEAARDVVLRAWDTFGHLDAVVNNAARPMRRSVTRLTLADVEDVMRTNFLSPTALTLAVLPRMIERDAGIVVNVASIGGRMGIGNEAAYNASKFALTGWSEAMQMDLWHTGVEVRLIHPGAVATEIWDQPGNDPAPYDGPFEPAEDTASAICDALLGTAFETYPPDMKGIIEFKTAEIDVFMAGAVEFIDSKQAAR